MKHLLVGFRSPLVNTEDNVIFLSTDETHSSLLLKLGTVLKREILHLSYVDDEEDEVSCGSECEFKELLKVAKNQGLRGKHTIIQVETGDPLPKVSRRKLKKKKMKIPSENNLKKIPFIQSTKSPVKTAGAGSSMENTKKLVNLDLEKPPAWFTDYMLKFRENLLGDVAHVIHSIIDPFKEDHAKMICWMKQNTECLKRFDSNVSSDMHFCPKQIESEHNYATSNAQKEEVVDSSVKQALELNKTEINKGKIVQPITENMVLKEKDNLQTCKDGFDISSCNSVFGDDDFSVLSGEISVTDSDSENEQYPGNIVAVPMPACFSGLKIRSGVVSGKSLTKRNQILTSEKQTHSLVNNSRTNATSVVSVLEGSPQQKHSIRDEESASHRVLHHVEMDLSHQQDEIRDLELEDPCSFFDFDRVSQSDHKQKTQKCQHVPVVETQQNFTHFPRGDYIPCPQKALQQNIGSFFDQIESYEVKEKGDFGRKVIPGRKTAESEKCSIPGESPVMRSPSQLQKSPTFVTGETNAMLRESINDDFKGSGKTQNVMLLQQPNQYAENYNHFTDLSAVYPGIYQMDAERSQHNWFPPNVSLCMSQTQAPHLYFPSSQPVHSYAQEPLSKPHTLKVSSSVHRPSASTNLKQIYPFVSSSAPPPFSFQYPLSPQSCPIQGQQHLSGSHFRQDFCGEQMPETLLPPIFNIPINNSNFSPEQDHQKKDGFKAVQPQNHKQSHKSHGEPMTILPEKLMQIASSAVSTACNIVGSLGTPGNDTTPESLHRTTDANTSGPSKSSTALKQTGCSAFKKASNMFPSPIGHHQVPESTLVPASIFEQTVIPQYFNPFPCINTDISFTSQRPKFFHEVSYHGNSHSELHKNADINVHRL